MLAWNNCENFQHYVSWPSWILSSMQVIEAMNITLISPFFSIMDYFYFWNYFCLSLLFKPKELYHIFYSSPQLVVSKVRNSIWGIFMHFMFWLFSRQHILLLSFRKRYLRKFWPLQRHQFLLMLMTWQNNLNRY